MTALSSTGLPYDAQSVCALLSAALDSSPVPVAITRPEDGRVVYVNAAFTRVFEYAPEDVLNRSSTQIGFWEDPALPQALVERLVRGEPVVDVAVRYRAKSGRVGDLRVTANLVSIDGAQHIVGILNEVTDARSVERERHQAGKRLSIVLNAARTAVFHQDRELRYTWVANPALGVTEHDVIGRTDDEILGAESAREVGEIKRRVLETGIGERHVLRVQNRNGRAGWFDVLVEPEFDLDGRVTGILAAAADVTEARQHSAMHSECDRRFRHLLENVRLIAVMLDAHGVVTFCNDRFLQVTGWRRDEVVGRDWFERFVPPEVAVRMVTLHAGEIATGRLEPHFENEILTRDGGRRLLAWDNTLLRASDGTVIGTASIGVDVTGLPEAEAELAAARDKAEAESAARSAYVSGLGHELRTPLNAIQGMSFLLRRSGLTREQSERVDKIEAAGRRFLAIIEPVVELARIEAGRVIVRDEPIDVATHVQEAAGRIAWRAQGQAPGPDIRAATEAFPTGVHGDGGCLQKALSHYIVNAVEFGGSGPVTVRARPAAVGAGYIVARFEVEDTGPGIDPAILPQLFTLPPPPTDAATRNPGGRGLGLVIVRRLAELMGGEAGVDSSPGKGSTFWFTARLGLRPRG